VLDGIASAIQSGIAWIVSNSIDWWIKIPSPDLAAEPAVGQLQHWMLPVTAAVAVLGVIIAGGKMVLTRKGSPLIDMGSTGGHFGSRLADLLMLQGAQPTVVIVLGVIAIIISAIQAVLMLFRQASMVILAGVLPLAAAGTLTRAIRPWFKKVTGWMLALIFYKPAAAAVYATAFTLIGTGKDMRTILMGFAMVLLSLLALPVLMRLFTWTTGQVADSATGGGFLQTALSGAVAVGALRGSPGGSGGSGAAEQARLVSAQLGPADSGPQGARASHGGAGHPPRPAPEAAGAAGAGQGSWAGTAQGGGAGAAGGTAGAGTAAAPAAAAGGPAGIAVAGLAAGAATANRKATQAMQPPGESGEGQR
jgi:hypothetical protein